jgi:hypothetical protein
MMVDTQQTQSEFRRGSRRWFAVVCAVVLVSLVGCKSNKDADGNGSGVSRGKNDPLFASGPNLIPKQNVPIPDRAIGSKGRQDPLKTTGISGEKIGYSNDPERFKGTVILGERSTTAALAGRPKDSDELRIDDGGVQLKPASGVLPGGTLEPPAEVAKLYEEFDQRGIKREDRSLTLENGKWVFRASVRAAQDGPRTQYTGVGDTAAEAVKQVLKQIK